MAAFSMFAGELDKSTQAMLAKGERLTEILKQDQYSPLPMEKQVLVIFAATNGFLDGYPVSECRRYERELYTFVEARHPQLLTEVAQHKELKGDLPARLRSALEEFRGVFQVQGA
jgi:F-type H+-transporting ATPase subunit alpha